MTYLEFQSSCCYCRKPIDDINKVRCYPAIDRSKELPTTLTMTPKKRAPGQKRDIQQLEIDDVFGSPTPVHLADKMHTISGEEERFSN